MRIIKLLTVLLLMVLILPVPRVCADDEEVTEDENGNLPFGYVRSVNAINSGVHATSDSLALAAEYAMNRGYYDQAIKLSQQAIQKDDNDCDVHLIYADALTHKLHRQKPGQKDPNLFMAAVREWLIVARAERGDEKGLASPNGLSIPMVQSKYADEDRGIRATHEIIRLVGYMPKQHETDMKFLQRVAKQCEYSTKIKMIPKSESENKGHAAADPVVGDAKSTKNRDSKSAQAKNSEPM